MPAIQYIKASSVSTQIDLKLYRYGILESASSVRLVEMESGNFNVDQYDAGLLFGPAGEVRCKRRRSGQFHLVFMDDGEGSLEVLGRGMIALWGEPDGDSWQEGRIPTPITEYPAALKGTRVGVSIVRYRFNVDGKSVFLFRCKDLCELETTTDGNTAPL